MKVNILKKNKTNDIIGKQFGLLTVISYNGINPNYKRAEKVYLCSCKCGNTTLANRSALIKGEKKSCGCLRGKNNFLNLTGEKFGNLTVLERLPNKNKHIVYRCICECGNYREVASTRLKSGEITSCGCSGYKLEHHHLSNTRLCRIWRNMKTRCYNKNSPNYKYYGEKGVLICDEWRNSFSAFYDWSINNGYSDNLTIDRINPFGNYEPNNCRWVTYQEQATNQRRHYKN